ncbi:MAG: nitroreductase family protein [Acidimicrobiales bacterium]
MDLYEALYTTRAMRRVRPDPVPVDAQARILDAAVRAPSGGNQQGWRFLLVDDPAVKARLGPLYRDSVAQLWATIYAGQVAAAAERPDDPESTRFLAVQRSAQWLADHFEQVPLFLFPFALHDPTGGSIYPAVWSAMLAARAEGIGSCLTVVLGVFHLHETLEILGVPGDEGWVLTGCVSFGYPTGRWDVAPRRPAHEVTYRNRWGGTPGLEIPEPLWPGR